VFFLWEGIKLLLINRRQLTHKNKSKYYDIIRPKGHQAVLATLVNAMLVELAKRDRTAMLVEQ
jgi:hypothetical protein